MHPGHKWGGVITCSGRAKGSEIQRDESRGAHSMSPSPRLALATGQEEI